MYCDIRCAVDEKCAIMNFFNDSFKTLKSALEEKINFDDPEEETRKQDDEKENLKKLVQHQSDEVRQ